MLSTFLSLHVYTYCITKTLILYRQVGDEGAKMLAQIFAQNNAAKIPLETLGLGVNAIGTSGAAALAHALEDCSECALKTLGLYRNSVSDDGAVALAKMVTNNQIALSHLFLGGNGIGNSGAMALADSLKQNNKLKVCSSLLSNS